MTRLADVAVSASGRVPTDVSGAFEVAQLGNISGANKNFDQTISPPVQGRDSDGIWRTGKLILRVYGTGYVRYYLKGTGTSHPLPPGITSTSEARAWAEKQIKDGAFKDLQTVTPRAVVAVQAKGPDGQVRKMVLEQSPSGTGETRYFARGQAGSAAYPLPTSVNTVDEARAYIRKRIERGEYKNPPLGDQRVFAKLENGLEKRGFVIGARIPDDMSRNVSQIYQAGPGGHLVQYNNENIQIELLKREQPGAPIAYFVRERNEAGKPSQTLIYLGTNPSDTQTARATAITELKRLLDGGQVKPARVGFRRATSASVSREAADQKWATALGKEVDQFELSLRANQTTGETYKRFVALKKNLDAALKHNKNKLSNELSHATQRAYETLFLYIQNVYFDNFKSSAPDTKTARAGVQALLRDAKEYNISLDIVGSGAQRVLETCDFIDRTSGFSPRQRLDQLVDKGSGQAVSDGLRDLLSIETLLTPLGMTLFHQALKKALAKKLLDPAFAAKFNRVFAFVGGAFIGKDIVEVIRGFAQIKYYYRRSDGILSPMGVEDLSKSILKEIRGLSTILGGDVLFAIVQAAPQIRKALADHKAKSQQQGAMAPSKPSTSGAGRPVEAPGVNRSQNTPGEVLSELRQTLAGFESGRFDENTLNRALERAQQMFKGSENRKKWGVTRAQAAELGALVDRSRQVVAARKAPTNDAAPEPVRPTPDGGAAPGPMVRRQPGTVVPFKRPKSTEVVGPASAAASPPPKSPSAPQAPGPAIGPLLGQLDRLLFGSSDISSAVRSEMTNRSLAWAKRQRPTAPGIALTELLRRPDLQAQLLRDLAADKIMGNNSRAWGESLGAKSTGAAGSVGLRQNLASVMRDQYSTVEALIQLLSPVRGAAARLGLVRTAVARQLGAGYPLSAALETHFKKNPRLFTQATLINLVSSPVKTTAVMIDALVATLRAPGGGKLDPIEQSRFHAGLTKALAPFETEAAKHGYINKLSNSPQTLKALVDKVSKVKVPDSNPADIITGSGQKPKNLGVFINDLIGKLNNGREGHWRLGPSVSGVVIPGVLTYGTNFWQAYGLKTKGKSSNLPDGSGDLNREMAPFPEGMTKEFLSGIEKLKKLGVNVGGSVGPRFAATPGMGVVGSIIGEHFEFQNLEALLRRGAVLYNPATGEYSVATYRNSAGEYVLKHPTLITIGRRKSVSPSNIPFLPKIPGMTTIATSVNEHNHVMTGVIPKEFLDILNRALNAPLSRIGWKNVGMENPQTVIQGNFSLPGIPAIPGGFTLPKGWKGLAENIFPQEVIEDSSKWSKYMSATVRFGPQWHNYWGIGFGGRIERVLTEQPTTKGTGFEVAAAEGALPISPGGNEPFHFISNGKYLTEIIGNDQVVRQQGAFLKPSLYGQLHGERILPGSVINAINGFELAPADMERIILFLKDIGPDGSNSPQTRELIYRFGLDARSGFPLSADGIQLLRNAINEYGGRKK